MTYVCEELRLGRAGQLRGFLRVAQIALGQHLLGDVTRRAAIAQKPTGRIEERISAHRTGSLRMITGLSHVGEIAERLVAVQQGKMLLPFYGVASGIRCNSMRLRPMQATGSSPNARIPSEI